MKLSKTFFNNSSQYYPVQSITYPYLKELVKKIEYNSNDVFVDVGCAWGRLIGYMLNKTDINKFIGIEINTDVANVAKKAFVNNPRVSIYNSDILKKIPEEGTIFYLFNPFNEEIMKCFLKELENNITHEIRLLYLYPTEEKVFNKRENWEMVNRTFLTPKFSGLGEIELLEFKYTPNCSM